MRGLSINCRYLMAVVYCLTCFQAVAAPIHGNVVSIADGDSITVLTPAKQQIKVRLAEIDTPERRQPYGKRAKQALSTKIFGKDVEVVKVTTDRYKRLVGKVYLNGRYINAEMVADGVAWVYRKYSKDARLLRLEDEARLDRRGLWGGSDPVPPWAWRKDKRNRR